MPADSILGKDFIKQYKCDLTFSSGYLALSNDQGSTATPILNEADSKFISIPPHCEVIRKVNVKNREDSVIENNEIIPGRFVASTIVNWQDQYGQILNASKETKVISKYFKSRPLEEYNIL